MAVKKTTTNKGASPPSATTIGTSGTGPVKVNRKLSLVQLIGLSIAFYGSIRNVPQVAAAGYSSILWMFLTVVIFVIPMGFIAAELATGWSKRGGPEVWVKEAIGKKSGFLVAWLLWVQMFFGMVIISVGFGTMLAYCFGNPIIKGAPWMPEAHGLDVDPIFLLCVIIINYWIVTLINIYYKKAGSSLVNVGSVIGIYIPFIALALLGIIFISIQAVNGNLGTGEGNIGNLPTTFLPESSGHADSTTGLQLFSQIMWIFIGLEIASTRANDIDNPKKNYPKALLITLVMMVVFNLGIGFIFASIVPNGEISLAQAVIIPFDVIFTAWGIEGLTPVFALMMGFGMFSQLNSWILGPSNAMYATARQGTMPMFFHKKTANGVPIVFVILQAIAVTCIAGLYCGLTIAGLGNVFGILLNETIILYCIAYILMIISYIILKFKDSSVVRAFTVPGKKVGAWTVTVLALCAVMLAVVLCFFQGQPSQTFTLIQNVGIYVGGTILFCALPYLFALNPRFKAGSWVNQQELAEAD